MNERITYLLERIVVPSALVALAMVSLLDDVFGVDVPNSIVLGSILLAVAGLTVQMAPVARIESATSRLLELAEQATHATRYRTTEEFYSSLRNAIGTAQRSLHLTHIRDEPPQAFARSDQWYDELATWARAHPEVIVRRIVAARTSEMQQWCRALVGDVADVPSFQVNVVPWAADYPMINMAIVDREMVFLAITGATAQETSGVMIADEEIARYFVDYYQNIWQRSHPLEEAILQFDERGGEPSTSS